MAKDKTLTLEEIEKAFSNLRTYSYSPSVNADKIIELCGLDNLEKYKSIIGQKLQRFQNGDSDDINPIEILGEQPKGGIFGLKRKKIDRENWERFYTQEGRQQIIDLVMKNAGESYDKYQEAAKACADEQGDLKRLQLYFSALDAALDAMKAWEIYDTTILLQDNPFFLQDMVKWYGLHPMTMEGQFALEQGRPINFDKTPYEHWTKELEASQQSE